MATRAKTILAPVDFSGVTSAVVENAVTLGRAVGGRVVIIHVVPPAMIPGDTTPMVVDLSKMEANEAESAAARLSRLREQWRGSGVEVGAVELAGIATVQILEQAGMLAADYIVMGSHGHGAVYDLLIGGTTQAILKRARCPVVVVPSDRDHSARAAE